MLVILKYLIRIVGHFNFQSIFNNVGHLKNTFLIKPGKQIEPYKVYML